MDKTKKKTIKRAVSWIALAALVALLSVMPLLARQEQEADGPVASILEGTVATGSISTSLKGGGTLEAGKAREVKLPSGVKIKEFLVKNGQTVSEGDPVAAVDKVSVMNAIVSVQDTMDYLQKQLVNARDETVSGTIRATAGGLVKQVFAQKGDSVRDVMLEHGALAVLSLDGRMAVELESKTDLAAGDTVCVAFPDKTEVDGRVESNLSGVLIVTVEDDDYAVGETVTVTTEDGDRLGTGQLYVHNAWKATAFSGTVNRVYAKENTDIHEGATLLTLKDTDFEGTLQSLANLHREYEELLQKLFVMYETEVITAPSDGMVSGVDEDSPFLLAAVEGDQGWTIQLLSAETVLCTKNPEKEPECMAQTHEYGCYYYCTKEATCTARENQHQPDCLTLCTSATKVEECPNTTPEHHKKDCIGACDSNKEAGKCPGEGAHKPDCIESCISSDGTKECPATGAHKKDCIKSCDKTESCTATKHHYSNCLTYCTGDDKCTAENHKPTCYMANLIYYGYASLVEQVGTDGLIVRQDTATRYQLATGSSGWKLIDPQELNKSTLTTPGKISVSGAGYKAGDVIIQWTGYKDGEAVKTGIFVYTNLAPAAPDGGIEIDVSGLLEGMENAMQDMLEEMMGSMMGGLNFGNYGSYGAFSGAGQTQQVELYDLEGDVLLTVTEQDAMTLTIAVDETDISKVKLGQIADVKVTALKGEIFEAEVTDISIFGTNNGGSSKFPVELTLTADPRMLAGMNATAQIPLFTKMEVTVIPVAALVETETGTCVYTALDQKTGEPTAAVEVTTGVSDGEMVEILSGLNPGDRFCYSYYDVLELDHTAKNEISFK